MLLDLEIDTLGKVQSNTFKCDNCGEPNRIDKFIDPSIMVGLNTTFYYRCVYCNQGYSLEVNSINYLFDHGKHLTRDDWW